MSARKADVDKRIAKALRAADRLGRAIEDAVAAQDIEGPQIAELAHARKLVMQARTALERSTLERTRQATADFEARRNKYPDEVLKLHA